MESAALDTRQHVHPTVRMRPRYAVPDLLLGLVVIVGAILLALEPLFGGAAIRLLIAILTLTAAGLLVHRLGSGRDRLVAELSERAMTDGLTGLLNRAALEERAIIELARARRDGTPVSLVVWTWTASSCSTTHGGIPRATSCSAPSPTGSAGKRAKPTCSLVSAVTSSASSCPVRAKMTRR